MLKRFKPSLRWTDGFNLSAALIELALRLTDGTVAAMGIISKENALTELVTNL